MPGTVLGNFGMRSCGLEAESQVYVTLSARCARDTQPPSVWFGFTQIVQRETLASATPSKVAVTWLKTTAPRKAAYVRHSMCVDVACTRAAHSWFTDTNGISCTTYEHYERRPAVDCVVGNWSAWGECQVDDSCSGSAVKNRTKPVLVEPSGGGLACEPRAWRPAQ